MKYLFVCLWVLMPFLMASCDDDSSTASSSLCDYEHVTNYGSERTCGDSFNFLMTGASFAPLGVEMKAEGVPGTSVSYTRYTVLNGCPTEFEASGGGEVRIWDASRGLEIRHDDCLTMQRIVSGIDAQFEVSAKDPYFSVSPWD